MEDSTFAEFFESADPEADRTARGIVQCLRMLADEAAVLGLGRTLTALQTAISTCAGESEAAPRDDATAEVIAAHRPSGVRLH